MSLQPRMLPDIPEETRRVAQAIYPKGNLFMKLRDEIGELFAVADFAGLYAQRGQPGLSPARLALVLLMQYLADYSDRQAAEAVRDQISWKYALSLPLESQGFDYAVLSEFRQRLVNANVHDLLFKPLLEKLAEKGLLKGRSHQRTDASHVLARVRNLNRLELVGEALRVALNRLARLAPVWLQTRLPPDWYGRYAGRFNTWHLPKDLDQRQQLMHQIGADGYGLFGWLLQDPPCPDWQALNEIEALRHIWLQQFWLDDQDHVQVRMADNMPQGAQQIASPFDLEARFSQKPPDKAWSGYKTHLTETCAAAAPRIITQVHTVAATEHDSRACLSIQSALIAQGLARQEHYVDRGYASLTNLIRSREQGIDLLCPMRTLSQWQPNGLAGDAFVIDWAATQVHCPNGSVSRNWSLSHQNPHPPVIQVRFAARDCQPCPLKVNCTRAKSRSLKLYPQAEHEVLVAARARQKTPAFQEKYRIRAGIEATFSMAVRDCDFRHSPFVGLRTTGLHALLVAAAVNVIRALNWLNDVPLATTDKPLLDALLQRGVARENILLAYQGEIIPEELDWYLLKRETRPV